jgi:hypothetical protein
MGPVESAVVADLESLDLKPGSASLAASAVALARKLDEDAGLATAAVARELRATMTALVPVEDGTSSDIDDLVAALSAPL